MCSILGQLARRMNIVADGIGRDFRVVQAEYGRQYRTGNSYRGLAAHQPVLVMSISFER
jgi:hypothetical protein